MKTILENWRQYLKEENSTYKLYCDLDGVLVDLMAGMIPKVNEVIEYVQTNIQDFENLTPNNKNLDYAYTKRVKKIINSMGGDWDYGIIIDINDIGTNKFVRDLMYYIGGRDETLWTDLPWMPSGPTLWDHIKDYNPTILTAAMGTVDSPSCRGKLKWVQKNLGSDVKVICTTEKGSQADSNSILIDDRDKYVNQFMQAGGIAIKHNDTSLDITLKELAKYGL